MSKTKQVILFNGPPGVGKDTAVNHAFRHCINAHEMVFVKKQKMAEPLKNAVHALFDLAKAPAYYDEVREDKEKSIAKMYNMSPRGAYIGFSEKAIKPWLGNDVFGVLAANKIHNDDWTRLHLFSDGGFVDEWVPIVDCLGPDAIRVVELYSPTCSFANDSRGYIGEGLKDKYPSIKVTRINNNITDDPFDRQLFLTMVQGVVDQVLGG